MNKRVDASGNHGVSAAARVFVFEGVQNFRDLGGYRTVDGGVTAWGRLYRSAVLSRPSTTDRERLAALGLRTVLDLRTEGERRRHSCDWVEQAGLKYWAHPYDKTAGALARLLEMEQPTTEDARAAMHAIYRELPYEQAPALRELFSRCADGELPLVFGCTAGKDRTGIAAALLLTAVGVPRVTVFADYALTERVLNALSLPSDASPYSRSHQLDPATRAPLLRSDPAYLAAAFDAIEQAHGSIAAYLVDLLDVSTAMHAQLRARLLSPEP